MAVTESTRVRAPRGSKILTKAFFAALDEIPGPRRAAVAKAAQLAIRDELRARDYKDKAGRGTRDGSGAGKPPGPRRAGPGRPRRARQIS